MKKSLTVLAAAAMAGTLILGGCAKPEAVEAEKPETAEDTVLGGWTPYTEYVQLLDENDKVLFEEAMEGPARTTHSWHRPRMFRPRLTKALPL